MSNHNYCSGSNQVQECEKYEQNESAEFDVALGTKVKNYPCIYSKSNKKDNKDKISTAWLTIASELEKSVDQCQSRFVRLRQYYSKERTKKAQGIAINKYEYLSYLEPYMYTRSSKKPTKAAIKSNSSDKVKDEWVQEERIEESIAELPQTYQTSQNSNNLLDVYETDLNVSTPPVLEEYSDTEQTQSNKSAEVTDKSIEDIRKMKEISQKTSNHESGNTQADNKAVRDIIVHRLQRFKCTQKKNEFIMKVMKILFK
ncbi:hypothetical protein TKK_0018241 [Trichogramma kaykai]|uniref:MADF domain-containing protein n=1 Tax=Trichogramma kaykai TaxID=54128 RepID=A0ABD2VZY3_9HYME